MELKIKYFGVLAEIAGCNEEKISTEQLIISDVIDLIIKKHPGIKGRSFKIAQNKVIVNNATRLDGSEIAVLPPFSGG